MPFSSSSSSPAYLSWHERPLAELLRIGSPMIVSLLSLSAMTVVDTLFIGRLGKRPLAASGLGGVVVFTVVSFGLAVLSAAKVKVGEAHGQGDTSRVRRSLGAFLRLGMLLGLLSMGLTFVLAALLPRVVADPETAGKAASYCQIRAGEVIFALLTAALGQWLQAQGDSQTSMKAALVANVVNVPLNYVFIFTLDGGIAGAALATVVARVVEFFWMVMSQLSGRVSLHEDALPPRSLMWNESSWKDAWLSFRVGLPTGTERVLDMVAFAAVPLLLAQLGPAQVGAHQIVLQIMMISFLPMIALGEALSVLISQAVGARVPALVRRLAFLGTGVALVYALLCGGAVWGFARPLARAFTDDAEVIEAVVLALSAGAILQVENAVYNQLKGALRGLSDFGFVAWVTVGCAWIVTPPFTYLVGVRAGWGVFGAWCVLCVEVGLGVLILAWRLRSALLRLEHNSKIVGFSAP